MPAPALRSILCPVDFSEQSRDALRWAGVLANQFSARLTVFTALDPLLAEAAKTRFQVDLAKSSTEPALQQFVDRTFAPRGGGIAVSILVSVGHAPDLILRIAQRETDLVVMGTHGLGGLRKLILGSTVERVLRRTPVPVFAVPPAARPAATTRTEGLRLDVHRILVGTDFSESSIEALRVAAEWARAFHVPLVVSHVVAPIAIPPQWRKYAADMEEEQVRSAECRLASLLKSCRGDIHRESLVSTGRPAEALARIAGEHHAGMIVVGLTGDDAKPSVRPGSIAYRLLCLTRMPVLVVPRHP